MKRIDIPRGASSLIDSLKDSFFTGYIKIKSGDSSHALIIFDDGSPVGVLRIGENSIEITNPEGYSIPSEGKVEVYETDPIVVTSILRGAPDPVRDKHLVIAGTGDPLQHSLPARAVNYSSLTEGASGRDYSHPEDPHGDSCFNEGFLPSHGR